MQQRSAKHKKARTSKQAANLEKATVPQTYEEAWEEEKRKLAERTKARYEAVEKYRAERAARAQLPRPPTFGKCRMSIDSPKECVHSWPKEDTQAVLPLIIVSRHRSDGMQGSVTLVPPGVRWHVRAVRLTLHTVAWCYSPNGCQRIPLHSDLGRDVTHFLSPSVSTSSGFEICKDKEFAFDIPKRALPPIPSRSSERLAITHELEFHCEAGLNTVLVRPIQASQGFALSFLESPPSAERCAEAPNTSRASSRQSHSERIMCRRDLRLTFAGSRAQLTDRKRILHCLVARLSSALNALRSMPGLWEQAFEHT